MDLQLPAPSSRTGNKVAVQIGNLDELMILTADTIAEVEVRLGLGETGPFTAVSWPDLEPD